MSDIATFARVKRPVVSTWRRRHPDFPAAVSENSGRPLFDGAQVTDWLIATGLGNAAPQELRSELALFGIIALRDRFTPWQLVETLGSLLCLRQLDRRPLADDGANASPIAPPDAEVDEALWSALLRRAERIDAEDDFVLRELRSIDVHGDRRTVCGLPGKSPRLAGTGAHRSGVLVVWSYAAFSS
ncbi:hypothetical protein [Streptomyces sp. 039-1]|uniref:hypothetical protein n=1 Tax=Streptomyces sp. 039-1 TaxID=2789263 RepID=UPI0039F46632